MTIETKNLAQERAERLLFVRKDLLRLTRDELSKFSNISSNSIQNWEQMRNKGLTEEGAQRLVEAYREKGVVCSVEWLMYGTGEKPASIHESATSPKLLNEEDTIRQELAYFKQLNHDSLDHIINDDSMLPCLWPGDFVAGRYYEGEMIKLAIDLPCIIETSAGSKLVRLVQSGDQPNRYHLISLNTQSFVKKLNENVEIVRAAPILWIRRRSYQK